MPRWRRVCGRWPPTYPPREAVGTVEIELERHVEVDDRAPDGNDLYLVLAPETVGTITARDRL
jgi:hypothetical protein